MHPLFGRERTICRQRRLDWTGGGDRRRRDLWTMVLYGYRVTGMSTELVDDIEAQKPPENQVAAKRRAISGSLSDFWLRHHLTQLYGHGANEPLPDELLALLEARLG